jgi:hypothetical protein
MECNPNSKELIVDKLELDVFFPKIGEYFQAV